MVFLVKAFSNQLWIIWGVVSFLPCLGGIQMHSLALEGRRSCGEDKGNYGFWDSWGPVPVSTAVHMFFAKQVLHKIREQPYSCSHLCKKSVKRPISVIKDF